MYYFNVQLGRFFISIRSYVDNLVLWGIRLICGKLSVQIKKMYSLVGGVGVVTVVVVVVTEIA